MPVTEISSLLFIKKLLGLEQWLVQVPVLGLALPQLGGLLPARLLALTRRLGAGLWLGLEHVPTEDTRVLPAGERIAENRVQLPAFGVAALYIRWAGHNLINHYGRRGAG